MRFSVIISAAPETGAASSAIHFCQAVLALQHELYRLFFLAEGVRNSHPQNPLYSRWTELITKANLDAVCCTRSTIQYASASNIPDHSRTRPPFQIAGIGQLVDADRKSDRLITFGQ